MQFCNATPRRGALPNLQARRAGELIKGATGLGNQRVEIAVMVTPDGHSRLEFSRFLTPAVATSAVAQDFSSDWQIHSVVVGNR